MPDLLGKMTDGRVCVLKVDGGVVTLSHEKGFISKTLVKDTEFKLNQTKDVVRESGIKPYKSSIKLIVKYIQDDEEKELTIFSRNVEKVNQVLVLFENDIHERMELLKKIQVEYREAREVYLNLLQLDLEIIENLFTILSGLQGRINWGRLLEILKQVDRIEEEREVLANTSAIKLSFDNLRMYIAERYPEKIKSETLDDLETLLYGINESSKHNLKWFNKRINYLLILIMYHIWDITLSSHLEEVTWQMNEALSHVLDEALEMISEETGKKLDKPSDFESTRHWLYETVELLDDVVLCLDITSLDQV